MVPYADGVITRFEPCRLRRLEALPVLWNSEIAARLPLPYSQSKGVAVAYQFAAPGLAEQEDSVPFSPQSPAVEVVGETSAPHLDAGSARRRGGDQPHTRPTAAPRSPCLAT